jgi:RNA-directed DNA polymerase
VGNTKGAMESIDVYTKQQRIAELAGRHPELGFTSLAYYIDLEWLKEAYRLTRKNTAAGVDRVTAVEYEKHLEDNLKSLLERFKSGSYYAPPVLRVYIPKDDGKEQRPIGIPTLEDKVLQRAVVMLLTPLYEQDFLDCSHGFRPKRNVYQALKMVWKVAMDMRKCWVYEVDIRKYFDTVKPEHIREFLKKRVNDGVITRIIGKWLKAGVMEDGEIHYNEEGTPQGGVISPMLSNLYLHEVLDKWFEEDIQPRLSKRAKLIRFADDFVVGFESKEDAERFQRVLSKRFGKYGLAINEEKSRIIWFGRPREGMQEPDSFTFLGFTHYWGKSQKGNWTVKKKTARKKLKSAVRKIFLYCKANRHEPIAEQWKKLCRKVNGHYAFYGVTHNSQSLRIYLWQVMRSWCYWLGRRSRDNVMPWARFNLLLVKYPLPQPRIIHSCLANP